MPIITKFNLEYEVKDGPAINFKTGPTSGTSVQFTQGFGADILVQDGTSDLEISLQSVDRAQQVYVIADKAVRLKLVVQGQTLSSTPHFFTLIPNLPWFICAENIVGIYVSNTTGEVARVTVEGVGVDV